MELDAIHRVDELRCRALVIAGELDSTDIMANARQLSREAPYAKLVTRPDTGHEINLEQPARFTDLAVQFLHSSGIPQH
jgi:pimeloyl-ACP methyl ester carboxylesterase